MTLSAAPRAVTSRLETNFGIDFDCPVSIDTDGPQGVCLKDCLGSLFSRRMECGNESSKEQLDG